LFVGHEHSAGYPTARFKDWRFIKYNIGDGQKKDQPMAGPSIEPGYFNKSIFFDFIPSA